jgi:hypothetical protein
MVLRSCDPCAAQIFCLDHEESRRTVRRQDFFDWFDTSQDAQLSGYEHRDGLLNAMCIWVVDCLWRLENLTDGKNRGIQNYDQAFLEKEEELLSILEGMRVLCAGAPIAELPTAVSQYFQTGDEKALTRSLTRVLSKSEVREMETPSFGEKVYTVLSDVFTTTAARYLAEMSKH